MAQWRRPAWSRPVLSLVAAFLLGCVPPATGSGPGGGFGSGGGAGGGGIYLTSSGAETVLPAAIDRAANATRQAFDQLKIREATPPGQGSDPAQMQEIDGNAGDRDVRVILEFEEKRSTRVQVVARRSSTDWDKDYARTVLGKIVANTR
jgi:hypothetical protein